MRQTENLQEMPDINISHIRRVFVNVQTSQILFETYDIAEAQQFAEDNLEFTPMAMEAYYGDHLMGVQHFRDRESLN